MYRNFVNWQVKKDLKLITIEDLIKYRRKHKKLISREIEINLPTSFGDFNAIAYTNDLDGREHIALVKGDINPHEPTLVRVHSECLNRRRIWLPSL